MRKGTTVMLAERLQEFTCKALAIQAGTAISNAQQSIKKMREAGMIYIAKYLQTPGVPGWPVAVYRFGSGSDAEVPKATGTRGQRHAIRIKAKRAVLTEKYGPDVARKIINARKYGGADQIVIDGKTIYRRGPTPERFRA